MRKNKKDNSRYPNKKRNQSKKQGYDRTDDREEKGKFRTDDRTSPLNDFSWYNANPSLTYAASAVPFPYRPGMAVPIGGYQEYVIPGVLQLSWMPTIGQSALATDPASIAAKEIYAKVRSAFSGSLEADGPDFMIYFMALDSIFAYIASLKRIYRILNAYTPQNYSVPDVVLAALGVKQDLVQTLKSDRMHLFQVINELIAMTRKFRCPAVFPVFNRHYWLNDNIYTDADSANSQMFALTMDYCYKFQLQNTPDNVLAGGLTTVSMPYSAISTTGADSLYQFGRDLIDALAGWEDAYTISGYLTRAYEGVPVFTVDELRIDEQFAPVYAPEVLAQIENAVSIIQLATGGLSPVVASNKVTQDPKTNALLCNPKVTLSSNTLERLAASMPPWISVRSDNVTVEQVVENTRMKNEVEQLTGNIICGTEIMLYFQLWTTTANPVPFSSFVIVPTTQEDYNFGDVYHAMDGFLRSTAFDWAPICMLIFQFASTPGGSSTTTYTYPLGDIHNFTVVSEEQLRQINKICLYSEFNSFNL